MLTALRQALGDASSTVRIRAAEALGKLVSAPTRAPLARRLRDRLEASHDPNERDGCYLAIWYLLEGE